MNCRRRIHLQSKCLARTVTYLQTLSQASVDLRNPIMRGSAKNFKHKPHSALPIKNLNILATTETPS